MSGAAAETTGEWTFRSGGRPSQEPWTHHARSDMLSAVAAPDLDLMLKVQLRALVQHEELSVLLGAGASMAVGLPSWEALAVSILCGSGVIEDRDVARTFLQGQDAMLAVEAARGVLSEDEWSGLLREALYSGTDPFPSALHFAVARLAAERDAASTRLFTLNFDTLLEEAVAEAFDEVGRGVHPFSRASATPRGGADTIEVHHLHGMVARDPGASASPVILRLSDFVGLPEHSWQFGELQQALQRGPLILAGTSYRDPDIREWVFELTKGRSDGKVIALLARAGMGLSRGQFAAVQDALAKQWMAVGVEPVLLHDHADAAQAMRELLYVDEADYTPPKERAAGLWAALCSDFEGAQTEHSNALEEDRARLAAIIGADTNVTLWIADGGGSLVRWSSPDRTYRAADMLRRVPLGFDSPWIAGQCLAVDDVLAREPAEDPVRPGAGAPSWHHRSPSRSPEGLRSQLPFCHRQPPVDSKSTISTPGMRSSANARTFGPGASKPSPCPSPGVACSRTDGGRPGT